MYYICIILLYYFNLHSNIILLLEKNINVSYIEYYYKYKIILFFIVYYFK